jgi:proteasome lid subunit RPN8/RPN11
MTFGKEIKFTPYAYAKLIWMRDRGTTEVAGYATTGTNDPLLITDLRLIKQECTMVTFDLDPDDIVEDAERTLDMGLMPWQTHNILWHTHPGNSPNPSQPDEDNFVSAFSHPDWAIMFIVAEDGSTYCRLKMPKMVVRIVV